MKRCHNRTCSHLTLASVPAHYEGTIVVPFKVTERAWESILNSLSDDGAGLARSETFLAITCLNAQKMGGFRRCPSRRIAAALPWCAPPIRVELHSWLPSREAHMRNATMLATAALGFFFVCFHTQTWAEDNKSSETMKCKDGKTVTVSVTGNYSGCSKAWINGNESAQCTSKEQKATGGCNQNGDSFCDQKNTGSCTVSRTAAAPSTKSLQGRKAGGEAPDVGKRTNVLGGGKLLDGAGIINQNGPAAMGSVSSPPVSRGGAMIK